MEQLTEFGKVSIMLLTGVILVSAMIFLSKMLAPKKPTPLKLSSYECGEEPTGNSWGQFNPRFYVIALVFLLFDVELIFIFPWSTIFAQKDIIDAHPAWGWVTLAEMFLFVGILVLGLVYVWKRGDIEWIKPEQKLPEVETAIPKSVYHRINEEKYAVRAFTMDAIKAETAQEEVSATQAQAKPAFKPAFRRIQK
ncbi:NADH-quinone oxidoreductase subunit A [Arcticibacter sp. MXS-1]|uniref:NADH-quinone oxidoreductase subunit A n=1 Tax=Arcticibacter sp. MXS-1 TaxID=3341726 RepID=UPI0035A8B7CF